MDGGWSSHIQALAWAVGQTEGPIVEMGAGWYSTPLLHGFAEAAGRELWTVDDPHPTWVPELTRIAEAYERSWHHFSVGTYELPVDTAGGLVFADQSAGYRALSVIEAKIQGAGIIVVHDTEEYNGPQPGEPYPGMTDALESFNYRRDFIVFPQRTTAVSDIYKLDEAL
jgi:hypothetical protein